MANTVYDGGRGGKGFLECGVVLLLVWSIYQPHRFKQCLLGL